MDRIDAIDELAALATIYESLSNGARSTNELDNALANLEKVIAAKIEEIFPQEPPTEEPADQDQPETEQQPAA